MADPRFDEENAALKARIEQVLTQSEEERASFREQWDSLSAEALRLKEAHDVLHARVASLEQEKEAARVEHGEQRDRWSAQLDAATREFESLREQLIPPADLEAMRLRLVEEAAAPHRTRASDLEAELQRARSDASAARRDADRLRASHDAAALEHAAAAREAQAAHETALAEARAKLDLALAEDAGRFEPAERLRKLQRESAEGRVRLERLLEEVSDLRAENEALRGARDALEASQARRGGEDKAAAWLARTERESLERRIAHLGSQLDEARLSNQRLHEAHLRLEAEVRERRAAVDDAQHALASEQAAAEARSADAVRELERLKLEMERRHAEAGRREEALLRARDEAAAAAAAAQREASLELSRARDEAAGKARRLEAQRAEALEEVAALHSSGAAQVAAERDKLAGAVGEAATLRAELHGAVVAKEAAVDEAGRQRRRWEEAEARHAALAAEVEGARREAAESRARAMSLQAAEAEAAGRQDKLGMQLEVATRELARVKAESGALQAALVAKVKAAKRAWAKERQLLRQGEAARLRQVQALRAELERSRRGLPAGGGGGDSAFGEADPVVVTSARLEAHGLDGLVRDEHAVQAEIQQLKRQLLEGI